MSTLALLTGSRDEVREAIHDPRIDQAEAALGRFARTGALRDASAYARSCYSVVQEIVTREFPREVRRDAMRMAGLKVLNASTAMVLDEGTGWLGWSLAREVRDLAQTCGVEAPSLRAPRARQEGPLPRAALDPSLVVTLAQEVLRVIGTPLSLDEVQQTFGLSGAETGELFGVTRQAVDQWRQNGVPSERVADVERVRDVARVLYEELIPERIPQVVRNPARGLGGRSILQVLAEPEGAERVRAYLARLYAFEAA